LRRLVAVLIVMAALLVAADFGLRFYTERRIGQELASSLELSGRPSVTIGGFPFLLHFAGGEFPSATAEGEGVGSGPLAFEDLRLELSDVRVSPGRILGGEPSTIRARSGEGDASLTAQQLTDAFRGGGAPVTVRIEGGQLLIGSDQLPGEVPASVEADGRTLRLRPTDPGLSASFDIEFPAFIEGLVLTGVEVQGRVAVISFRLEEPVFPVG
jgi:hypothetical protein